LGTAHILRRKYKKALACIEKFLSLPFKSYDVEANLALIETYYALGRNEALNPLIGKLMLMKQKSDWNEFFSTYLQFSATKAYIPDFEYFSKIIHHSLAVTGKDFPRAFR